MNQFVDVLDEIQITTPNSSGIEQQRQSNPTIISKFRNNFLPNAKQLTSRSSKSSSSKQVFLQPSQESTTGNQILLSIDEITAIPKLPVTSSTTTTIRPRATTFIQDDAHV